MSIKRVVPNITTDRVEESRDFYVSLLGFQVVDGYGLDSHAGVAQQSTAQLSLVRGEVADVAPQRVTLSIEVPDVDEIHAKAISHGHQIVYPLTDEPWGVRRFHVADPNGVTVNVLSHIT